MHFNGRLVTLYAMAAIVPALVVLYAARGTVAESAEEILARVDAYYMGCLEKAVKPAECTSAAAPVVQAMARAKAKSFKFYKASHFKVMLQDGYMVLTRPNCSDADLAFDEFHWRFWPTDVSALEERWREHGFMGGVTNFSRRGTIANGTCLLVLKMPFKNVKSVEIGQYDRSKPGWVWRVASDVEDATATGSLR